MVNIYCRRLTMKMVRLMVLGYGVYRRTMENSFHLEHIKEELYRKQNNKEEIKTENRKNDPGKYLYNGNRGRKS